MSNNGSRDGFTTPPVMEERKSPPPIRRRNTYCLQPAVSAEDPSAFTLGAAHTPPRGVHGVLILPPAANADSFSNFPNVVTENTTN